MVELAIDTKPLTGRPGISLSNGGEAGSAPKIRIGQGVRVLTQASGDQRFLKIIPLGEAEKTNHAPRQVRESYPPVRVITYHMDGKRFFDTVEIGPEEVSPKLW